MPLRIGSVELDSPLTLAPLAGYTSLPFRRIIRELGGVGWCTTELINTRSLLEKNPNAFKLLRTGPEDRPLAVQLFGSVPEEMRDAARMLEELGAAMVDVNMGCPVPKVCKVGGGAAMLGVPDKTLRLVKMMAEAVKIPVTCKMRLASAENPLPTADFARALEEAGAAAITLHGRTRKQGYGGRVSLEGIRQAVQAVRSIPVIGNGDVTTPQAAKMMRDETGCAGISIGRGAFYNPWIFQQTVHFLKTGETPADPGFEARIRLMSRHLDGMVEVFGEEPACRMFRKISALYARGLGPAVEFKRQMIRLSRRAQFDEILVAYRTWRQKLVNQP